MTQLPLIQAQQPFSSTHCCRCTFTRLGTSLSSVSRHTNPAVAGLQVESAAGAGGGGLGGGPVEVAVYADGSPISPTLPGSTPLPTAPGAPAAAAAGTTPDRALFSPTSVAATAGHRTADAASRRGPPGEVYDFGGVALLSFGDVVGYLGARDEEELPVAVRRLHPVDAMVHGVLTAREARRAQGWRAWGQDKDKRLPGAGAGLQGGFNDSMDAAAAAVAATASPGKDKGKHAAPEGRCS